MDEETHTSTLIVALMLSCVHPLQMLGKEPVCDKVFDFDFEKDEASGRSDRLVPKKQRVIPGSELKALVLE